MRNVLLIALVIFNFGCGGGPVKPLMEVTTPDVPNQRVHACMTTNETWKDLTTAKGLTAQSFKEIVKSRAMVCEWKPIMHIDRGLCLDQLNSNIFIDYVHDLENYIKYQCKPRLVEDGESSRNSSGSQ